MGKSVFASLAAVLLLCAPGVSRAADAGPVYATIGPFDVIGSGPHVLDAGIGLFDFLDNHEGLSLAGRIELRIGKKLAYIGPTLGLLANNEGFRYGYAGIYADFVYGKIVLTPLLAAGVNHRGNSIDLGGTFAFRESLEIACRFNDRWRVGVSIAHISNADIYEKNPGVEDFLLTVAVGI